MRLKNKPKKPTRQLEKDYISIDFSQAIPLDQIKEYIEEQYVAHLEYRRKSYYLDIPPPLNKCQEVCLRQDGDWDSTTLTLHFSYLESEESFNQNLLKYERDIAKYNKWYQNNEVAIKQEIEKRQQKLIEERGRAKRNEEKRLRQELTRIKRDLKKLNINGELVNELP